MGGGGGGDTVTNVTNTGLGDDQYQSLYDNQGTIKNNQENIATSMDAARDDAADAYDDIFERLDTQDLDLGVLRSGIGKSGSNPTGLYAQFKDQNKAMSNNMAAINKQFSGTKGTLSDLIALNAKNQRTTASRFDDVDDGLATNLDGIQDNAQGIEDANTLSALNLGAVQDVDTDLTNFATASAGRFDDVDSSLSSGFADAQTNRDTLNQSAQNSRDDLATTLDSLATTQNTYYEDLSGTLAEQTGNQDTFVSNFDSYIERYDDNEQTAREQRSDILDAQENTYTNLRDDLGNFAQANADAAQAASDQIDTGFAGLGDTVEGGFQAVGDTVQDAAGFTQQTIQDEIGGLDFANTISALQQDVAANIGSLDAEVAAQFQTVSNAFDDQGQLITDTIDENGNIITRSIDDQGNLVETRFDAQGQQIGTTETNIRDAISNVENSLSGDMNVFATNVGRGFVELNENVDNNVAAMYGDLSSELAAQGIDINTVLQTSFNAQNNTLDVNGQRLLDLGSQLGSVDAEIAQDFANVSAAFDAQGNLIGQTVDDMGNTITNQIDQNGNLITNKFDAQGQQIASTETNITQTLAAANEMQNQIAQGLGTQIDSTTSGLASDMQSGFDAQQSTLSDQALRLLSMGDSIRGLSNEQQVQMQTIAAAFDNQGRLIETGSDSVGNLIQRQIDENENLIERRFDAQGSLIDDTLINLREVMSGVNQLGSISGQLQQGFGGIEQGLEQQQGLMAEMNQQTATDIEGVRSEILTGFNASERSMDTQVKRIAEVASQMTDLDMGMRQQFYQLDNAFDETGTLIQNSVDENGNTVVRSVDENGNLLLRAFDQTGNLIGQNVLDIGKVLDDLAEIQDVPGANISMGNLSPALQANPRQGEPNVPTSGFMSPFSQTV